MLPLRSIRTGEVLYALGNIRNAQDILDESFRYYQRALRVFNMTDEHGSSTAKTHYKLGVHYMRMGDWKNAGYAPPSARNGVRILRLTHFFYQ